MSRILIIEDSRTQAERLKLVLQQEGYDVVTAANGLKGLKEIQSNPPELVITDIIMPMMDGFEVIMYLKKHNPSIRIIAMTYGGFIKPSEYLKAIKQLGVDYTLVKPFRDEYLLAIVSKLFDNKYAGNLLEL